MNANTANKDLEEDIPVSGNLFKYKKLGKIGEGAHGEVFKAIDLTSQRHLVAVKKILVANKATTLPDAALREVVVLRKLQHENVVNLIDLCRGKTTQMIGEIYYLVFEFCEHDLGGLLTSKYVKFTLGEIKSILKQLFTALSYIHSKRILHRDIKPDNVLINKQGILKLADFGLARSVGGTDEKKNLAYTNYVVSLWYRPPELLLGSCNYGPAVDIWGAGCIMGEMWTRFAIVPGYSEQQQLMLISETCGSITPDVWPAVKKLKLYYIATLPPEKPRKLHERFSPVLKDVLACDLLDKILLADPEKRFSAQSALEHEFFTAQPLPCDLSGLLSKLKNNMLHFLIGQYAAERDKVHQHNQPCQNRRLSSYQLSGQDVDDNEDTENPSTSWE